MNEEKKLLKDIPMCAFDIYEYSKLEQVIGTLKAFNEEYSKKGYSNICFNYNNADEGYLEFELRGDRLETNDEFNERLKKETRDKENAEKSKKKQKECEYETYLKLKEKFEGNK